MSANAFSPTGSSAVTARVALNSLSTLQKGPARLLCRALANAIYCQGDKVVRLRVT